MPSAELSRHTLQRLPLYLSFLSGLPMDTRHVSAAGIAQGLALNAVQVRKDLAAISHGGGRPKTGYETAPLIADLRRALRLDTPLPAVLLGGAGLPGEGYADGGIRIVAAFHCGEDPDDYWPALREELRRLHARGGLSVGIVATPPRCAQAACDALVGAGLCAIWNFTPVHLSAPEHVLVQSEHLTASLAILARHLARGESERQPGAATY